MRRVCKICRSKFRPNRTDAEFCSNQCRQSAYRARKKDSIKGPRKEEDAKPYADLNGDYRGYAVYLRGIARDYDTKVRFMGTPKGILAVEEIPGALAAAPVRGALQQWRETRLHSTDREVVEAALRPQLGGSFIQRECEKECRDLLLKRGQQIYLFTWDWEYAVASSAPHKSLPSWDHEPDDGPKDDGLWSKQVKALLAGGGYRVGKAT
jgi:hypothetical protein